MVFDRLVFGKFGGYPVIDKRVRKWKIVMNSEIIPYKRRFLYDDDEEGTDFYSYEARSHEILGKLPYNENGSGNMLSMKMRARERERRKGRK